MKYKPQCGKFDAGTVTLQNRATKGDNWIVYELSAADSNGDCSVLIGPPTDTPTPYFTSVYIASKPHSSGEDARLIGCARRRGKLTSLHKLYVFKQLNSGSL